MTATLTTIVEPPVRADGYCARPGCNQHRAPERSRTYGQGAADLDPFCSTECCRSFYGVPLPVLLTGPRKNRGYING